MLSRRSKRILIVLALTACGPSKPQVPAPDVGIDTVLQSPLKTVKSIKELRGQALVLEFWATWCGPCIDLLPHMNKMVKSFEGQNVRFISVTDESREDVERFLRKHPMNAAIGLDPEGKVIRAFKNKSRPEVYIIDPFGRITLKIHPSWLYESDIRKAMKAKPPTT